jgi:hypothetical protein
MTRGAQSTTSSAGTADSRPARCAQLRAASPAERRRLPGVTWGRRGLEQRKERIPRSVRPIRPLLRAHRPMSFVVPFAAVLIRGKRSAAADHFCRFACIVSSIHF